MLLQKHLSVCSEPKDTLLSIPLSSGSELLDSLRDEADSAYLRTTMIEQMPVVFLEKSCGEGTRGEAARRASKDNPKAHSSARDGSARDCAIERLSRIISADRASLKVGDSLAKRVAASECDRPTAA